MSDDDKPLAIKFSPAIVAAIDGLRDALAAAGIPQVPNDDEPHVLTYQDVVDAQRKKARARKGTGRPLEHDDDAVRSVVESEPQAWASCAAVERFIVERFGVSESTAKRHRRRIWGQNLPPKSDPGQNSR